MTTTSDAYSARADEYTALLGSMDAVHPSDRQLVDTWAEQISGRVLDAGCGPGHWTGHLAAHGLDVRGIDLVPSFIAHARATFPGLRFDVESIDEIDESTGALDGILSWFSTIHHEPRTIAVPLSEFARTLRPRGRLLLGFFTGTAVEAFDHAVVRAYRWPVHDLAQRLDEAGFDVVEAHQRDARGARAVGALVCERRAHAVR